MATKRVDYRVFDGKYCIYTVKNDVLEGFLVLERYLKFPSLGSPHGGENLKFPSLGSPHGEKSEKTPLRSILGGNFGQNVVWRVFIPYMHICLVGTMAHKTIST